MSNYDKVYNAEACPKCGHHYDLEDSPLYTTPNPHPMLPSSSPLTALA